MIAIALMAVQGIYQSITGYQQGKAMAEAAENNARYASELALNKQKAEENQRRMRAEKTHDQQRRRRAKQEAHYATSGVLLDGTPSNYLVAQAETDELNAQRQNQASYQKQLGIVHAGQVQRNEYENQARAHNASANMALWGGMLSGAANATAVGASSGFSWGEGDTTGGTGNHAAMPTSEESELFNWSEYNANF